MSCKIITGASWKATSKFAKNLSNGFCRKAVWFSKRFLPKTEETRLMVQKTYNEALRIVSLLLII